MTIILLLVGLGLIVLGADWLVDGYYFMLLAYAAYYYYLFAKL